MQKGLTGIELARRAGVSPSYVSLIESGEKVPSEDVAVRLAHVLDEVEDIYRVWAVISRMHERTREALLRVSQRWRIDESDEDEGEKSAPDRRSARLDPRALLRGPDEFRGSLEEDTLAHSLAMPLLLPGAAPGSAAISEDEVESIVTIDRRLVGNHLRGELAALRVDETNGSRVRSWLRANDLAIVEWQTPSLPSERLHVVRVDGEGLALSRVAVSDSKLLLLPDPVDESPPRALSLAGEDALPGTLLGTVIASLHRWP